MELPPAVSSKGLGCSPCFNCASSSKCHCSVFVAVSSGTKESIRKPLSLNNENKPPYADSRLLTPHDNNDRHHQYQAGSPPPMPVDEVYTLSKQGNLDSALDTLVQMHNQGFTPSEDLYWSFLHECNKRKALPHVKGLYAHLTQHELDANSPLLGEYLLSTLVKCGDLDDGIKAFDMLQHRSTFAWTVLISGYTDCGKCYEALQMYKSMQKEGLQPNKYTFVSLLKASGSIPDLEEGMHLHDDAVKKGFDSDVFVGNTLVSMYGKCGKVVEAEIVFSGLSQRDSVSWNVLLTVYAEQHEAEKTLQLYRQMQEEGVGSTGRTLVIALQACGLLAEQEGYVGPHRQLNKTASFEIGQALHALARRKGFESDAFIASTLVILYAKCGRIGESENVFGKLSQCNVVLWNAMLSAYVEQGKGEETLQLYKQMQEEDKSPNERTFVIALQACGIFAEAGGAVVIGGLTETLPLEIGRALHADAQKKGIESDVFVENALLSMYSKCGSIVEAENVFKGLFHCNVVSWNALLSSYVEQCDAEEALKLYRLMQDRGVTQDKRTHVIAIQACCGIAEKEVPVIVEGRLVKVMSLGIGQALHADAHCNGFDSDLFVGKALISMYGKCGSIVEAEDVFFGLCHGDAASLWNALLSAYVEYGEGEEALQLYSQMREHGITSNEWTFVFALQACRMLAEKEEAIVMEGQSIKVMSLETGQAIHVDAQRVGLASGLFVGNALVSMYAKCGSIREAEKAFSGLSQRDIVSWTVMLSAYVEQGEGEKALQLHRRMTEEGVSFDEQTFVVAIQACCTIVGKEDAAVMQGPSLKVTFLESGRALHSDACRKGFDYNASVNNALVNMYSKFGRIAEAENVFGLLSPHSMMSWSCLLSAYVKHGEREKAFLLYKKMLDKGISLDEWNLVIVLQACCTIAAVEDFIVVAGRPTKVVSLGSGQAVHADAWRKGFDSNLFVGRALVSMYGQCGCTLEANKVFDGLSQHDMVSWNALLSAHVEHGEGEEALRLFQRMQVEGMSGDEWTFVITLKACCALVEEGDSFVEASLEIGQALHADARKKGLDSQVFVGSTLVSMYGRCGSIVEAENAFGGLSQRDVVSWTAMLSAYAEQSEGKKVLQLYIQMQEEGVSPNERTLVIALQALCMFADRERGDIVECEVIFWEISQALRADAWRKGFGSDAFVGNTLVKMLGKCGYISEAEDVFKGLLERDMVSWNVMLSAYAEQGKGEDAVQLYRQMQNEGINPNERTFVIALQACCELAEAEGAIAVKGQSVKVKPLEIGRGLHADARRKGLESNVHVLNTLMSMYSKCGSIVEAENAFCGFFQNDVVTWNSMISAYVEKGEGEKASLLYKKMQEEGVSPDAMTFVNALQACCMLAENEREEFVEGQLMSLEVGQALHADVQRRGFDSDVFVGGCLVSMYVDCGSIMQAESVFLGLLQSIVMSYNVMISAYVKQGELEKGLQIYKQMMDRGVTPNERTFAVALQACCMLAENEVAAVVEGRLVKVLSHEIGQALHADARRKGCDSDVFVGCTLIGMYGKCGSILEAENVFCGLSQCDVVAWTVMISAYVEQGEGEKALQLYKQMQEEGTSPNERTLVIALQACCVLAHKEGALVMEGLSAKKISLELGQALHSDVQSKAFDLDVFVGTALLTMYGKCGSFFEAEKVFAGLFQHDVVTWNAMLSAYVEQGYGEKALQLYGLMQEEGMVLDECTYVISLQACCTLAEKEEDVVVERSCGIVTPLGLGQMIHADACRRGFDVDIFICNTLVSLYGSCWCIAEADCVFSGLSQHNVVSWNVLIAAHVRCGEGEKALQLYEQMQEEGVNPDERTFVIALRACCILAEKEDYFLMEGQSSIAMSLEHGKLLHADACKKGFNVGMFVGNAFVGMYGKCGSIMESENVFTGLFHLDVVSWNAMLSAYIQQDEEEKALQFYKQMQEEGVGQDKWTFVMALQACRALAEKEAAVVMEGLSTKVMSLEIGQALHAEVQRMGFNSDVFVGTNLVSMYGKCGSIVEASNLIGSLSIRNIVLWTAIISMYVEQGEGEKALHMYKKMQEEGMSPNARTVVIALRACCVLAETEEPLAVPGRSTKEISLEIGEALHADALKKGFDLDLSVGNILVSMYGECGNIMEAEKIFSALSQSNIVSWNAMLSTYVEHGEKEKALQLYRQMQEELVSLDDFTHVCALQASSEMGRVEVCRQIHFSVVSEGFNPNLILATTLIHAYGSCGSMVDAQAVFDALPAHDVVSWSSLVDGFAHEGNSAASLQSFERMQLGGFTPNAITFISLFSACSHAGLVDSGVVHFEAMSSDHGVTAEVEHYASMIDLLGRAGDFARLEDIISEMPMQPDLTTWLCLLGASRKHSNLEFGKQAFDGAVHLKPKLASAYVLMSNIYADVGPQE